MATLQRASLRRSTLAEQAYRTLRERIVKGDLPAGHRLLPEEIGQALSISPTPVKEALAMLQRDGLIEVSARRGSTVRRFSARDVADLYDARLTIEARAIGVGLAAGRVDAAFLARLDACAAALAERSRHRSRAELRQALRLDHDLHTLIVALAGNAVLADWHQRLLRQTQLVRVYSLRAFDAGRLERAQQEHAAIIAALHAQDAPAAQRALETHLATSCANVLAEYA
ncbi:MAG: GntR family transcriptional regulator [Rhodospirillales bacterium]|nr:GntR family transcriptional regulator [Rhodospirillales bacterium]